MTPLQAEAFWNNYRRMRAAMKGASKGERATIAARYKLGLLYPVFAAWIEEQLHGHGRGTPSGIIAQ